MFASSAQSRTNRSKWNAHICFMSYVCGLRDSVFSYAAMRIKILAFDLLKLLCKSSNGLVGPHMPSSEVLVQCNTGKQ